MRGAPKLVEEIGSFNVCADLLSDRPAPNVVHQTKDTGRGKIVVLDVRLCRELGREIFESIA
jgi:hypothetical protein